MMMQASDPGPTDTHDWNDLGSLTRRLLAHVLVREIFWPSCWTLLNFAL
jgi:hypothetical protein